jgi:nucleotide-binding universal stress UspA family protein
MLKNVLVALDGSEPSRRALAIGSEVAVKFDGSLFLLYVIRDMQLPEGLREAAEVERIQGPRLNVLRTVGERILDDAQRTAKKLGAERIHCETRPGDPAGVILSMADQKNIDLVVMGSRGLGQVKSALLGSVSRKVANLAKVACLTVR